MHNNIILKTDDFQPKYMFHLWMLEEYERLLKMKDDKLVTVADLTNLDASFANIDSESIKQFSAIVLFTKTLIGSEGVTVLLRDVCVDDAIENFHPNGRHIMKVMIGEQFSMIEIDGTIEKNFYNSRVSKDEDFEVWRPGFVLKVEYDPDPQKIKILKPKRLKGDSKQRKAIEYGFTIDNSGVASIFEYSPHMSHGIDMMCQANFSNRGTTWGIVELAPDIFESLQYMVGQGMGVQVWELIQQAPYSAPNSQRRTLIKYQGRKPEEFNQKQFWA